MPIDMILGTAGHIDHGKTSLVKALTGVDTDRLPEEKRRGITIELGFAELELGDYRLGIVDVPGHQRYVRNMLAGASGMDLALLVVAADDSVKPQTREHLEILRLLRLKAGVIALTKCDLPPPAWIDLVEDEIRELTRDTFLRDAPLVRVSSLTGQGLSELRQALAEAAARANDVDEAAIAGWPFRMAVDRVFSMPGHGTVVTGSVVSGRAEIGDELVLEPGGVSVRVRGLQNHDRAVPEVHRGQRAAINLAGVEHRGLQRGQELASPGHLLPSKLLTVVLHASSEAPRPLKNRTRVRLHLGTAEIPASVVLLEADGLPPGQTALAQLFLSEFAVAVRGQAFVLRSESPAATIAGGQVLDPCAKKLARATAAQLDLVRSLASDDELERAAAAIHFFGLREWRPSDLARAAGIDRGQAIVEQLTSQGRLSTLELSPTRTLSVARTHLEELFERIETALARLHDEYPLHSMLNRARLAARLHYLGDDATVEALLRLLAKAGRVRVTDRGIALAGRGPQLTANEQKLVSELSATLFQAGFQPPSAAELQATVVKNNAVVPQLLEVAAAEGLLVRISPEFYLHSDWDARLRLKIDEAFRTQEQLTVSQIRDLLSISRKHAVPICEYLDRIGATVREGDARRKG